MHQNGLETYSAQLLTPQMGAIQITGAILLIVLGAILIAELTASWKTRHWNLRSPLATSPIIGALFALKEKPWETLRQVYMREKLGLYKVRIGYQHVVVINNVDAANQVFVRNGLHSASRPVTTSIMQTSSNKTPPPLGSSPWNDATRGKRTLVTSMLAKSSVQQFSELIEKEVHLVIKEIAACAAEGSFDPHDVLKMFSLNMSVGVTWGVTLDREKDAEWIREIIDVESGIEHSRYPIDLTEMLPGASYWLRFSPSYRQTQKDLQSWSVRREKYLDMLEDRMREAREDGTELPCVFNHIEHGGTRYELARVDRSSVLVSLLSAGLDAITWSVYWLLLYLAQHPELQAEIRQAMVDAHYTPLKEDDAEPPELLESIVKESLRYFTVNRLSLPRVTHQPIRIGNSYIPEGTMLIMNSWSLNRDPDAWERAEEFDPYRFLGEDHKNKTHYAFGLGRRNCPGQFVAQKQLSLLVAAIIHHFALSEDEPGQPLDPLTNVTDPWALASTPRRVKVCIEGWLTVRSTWFPVIESSITSLS